MDKVLYFLTRTKFKTVDFPIRQIELIDNSFFFIFELIFQFVVQFIFIGHLT